ncbi:hypothetical protein A5906_14030 [Bradyrhizobium sacchari]|uniref:Uncharacterized protein n=1 Tax=Bradyrhizobium sacchari TaxID=1399419 RepID=A0A560KC52_9BRAD|nr:hypothetical protein [Bradyrhizobium sacchari]OPY94431.1 hypothetical protein A5906_14030 [Bradyrhizobium sacchari]TWB64574.1 hypothetical protein FBZ94_102114 [Bradyrhizobium sacchari]TWB80898.1 hypothetical protein FBZ95_102115 [Bradyrhizobium sacchari]
MRDNRVDQAAELTDQSTTNVRKGITGAPISGIEFSTKPTAALQVNLSKLLRSAMERLDIYEQWGDYSDASEALRYGTRAQI